jgi:hypothetical protein
MGFRDLDTLFDDTLPLPIGGKVYIVPAPDAELGLWCQRMVSAGLMIQAGETPPETAPPLTLDDDDERALYQRMLGETFDVMVSDGISWPKIQLVGQTALLWIGSGRPLAEQFWNSGGDPEAFPPRRSKKAGTRGSTSTAAANTTKRQASTSGTRSRKANSKR